MQWIQIFGNPLTWDDLPWLRSLTDLPLLVKGICHPDDARRARDGGVDGIYCSNHGGRQANGGVPAIDCLPGVVEAADGTAGAVRFGYPQRRRHRQGRSAGRDRGRRSAGRTSTGSLSAVSTGSCMCCAPCWPRPIVTMAVDGYRSLKELTPDALRRVT